MTSEQEILALLVERVQEDNPDLPDLGVRDYVVLKNGPRAYKVASHLVIKDRKTGEFHHHAVQLKTWDKTKAGWKYKEPNSISLGDEDGQDEIGRLLAFLGALRGHAMPQGTGHYIVAPVTDGSSGGAIAQLIEATSAEGRADALRELLRVAQGDSTMLAALVASARANPLGSRRAAAALNIGRYRGAVEQLRNHINDEANEGIFQKHLEENFWMLGSDYSELLSRRTWTRDTNQDFMLRRNADNCLEVIEIKTPLSGKQLLRFDASHKTYFPGPELSAALGQVVGYVGQLDAQRWDITARDGEDVNKISARLIIGRDGDAQEQQALRSLNGHLHRIEVMTFDQLVRVAEQVVLYAERMLEKPDVEEVLPDDEEPF